MSRSLLLRAASTAALLLASPAALAATTDSEPTTVHSIEVDANRISPVVAKAPAVVVSETAAQIDATVNAMTAGEALKYLPSIEVRERYIGDRNGIISTRTTGTVSSAESLVYVDDLMVSNLLGNSYSYPPRWGLVAPSEITRIDILYGPFSAVYPGNSMGGVILLTTHMPDRPELHMAMTGSQENFSLYGVDEHNRSHDASIAAGDRFGPFSFRVDIDHLDAMGHPMSFSTANLSTKAATASATPVSGAFQDVDQNGKARLVFGAYSIDHSIQDQAKAKLGYDITPTLHALYTVGVWTDTSKTGVDSFLRNSTSGAPVFNGAVAIAGKAYTVSGVNPGETDETHVVNAVSLFSNSGGVFDFKLAASDYDYVKEHGYSASNYGVTAAGTDQVQNGTGWQTLDAQAVWRPTQDLLGRHEVFFGAHTDHFVLKQATFALANWQVRTDGAETAASSGSTDTDALYVQDVWTPAEALTVTLGLRDENWQARSGSNFSATTTPQRVYYPNESRDALSPKAAIAYRIGPDLTTRLSVGKAERFPTVTELYQQVTSGTTLVQNNPNLQPEEVTSYDWTTEYAWHGDQFRLSLFQEDRRNALFSQTDTTVSPNLTQIENISSARFQGAEGAFDAQNVVLKGLDLNGSVTLTHSEILSDAQAPTAVGKDYPRIPKWRARLVALYRITPAMTASVGYRFSSGAFSTLLNTDVNHGVYGGISSYSVVDLRLTYDLGHGIRLSGGVDNIGDTKYYVSPHPYPQTTGFIGIKYDY